QVTSIQKGSVRRSSWKSRPESGALANGNSLYGYRFRREAGHRFPLTFHRIVAPQRTVVGQSEQLRIPRSDALDRTSNLFRPHHDFCICLRRRYLSFEPPSLALTEAIRYRRCSARQSRMSLRVVGRSSGVFSLSSTLFMSDLSW